MNTGVKMEFAKGLLLAFGVLLWSADGCAQGNSTDIPTANPARPTVSTPATLTPPGYLQFETGVFSATHSPDFSSLVNLNEVVKLSVVKRLELVASSAPVVHFRSQGISANGSDDVFLGMQAVAYQGKGPRPTVALSYFRRVYGGDTPDSDQGSPRNSVLILASADVKGFHYDANGIFSEVIEASIHRAQFAQTLSISHAVGEKFTIAGEIWHFTQPFLRGNAVGNLWAVSYTVRPNLVLDGGFNRGLTSTSTRWEAFAGFTYLLPHKLWR